MPNENGKKTMLRHWVMLRGIPRWPYKKTAGDLTQKLTNEGYSVTKRTVERDLQTLSELFPILSDGASTGNGWSWARDAAPFDIPRMDAESALTFNILERFAGSLLPRSVVHRLQPQFDSAKNVLQQLPPDSGHRVWPTRVRTLSRSLDLAPPQISEEVIEAVYRALLEGRQLRADYRPRVQGGEHRRYDMHPLGLVFRDQVAYLVATLWDYQDIRQLALHRFDSAELLETARKEPDDFDLDRYIEEGHFDIRESGNLLNLRVRFASDAAYHLYETPLTANQSVTELDDGRVEIEARVHDTLQLRWWLLGFGACAEIVAPKGLRTELQQEITRMARLYADTGRTSAAAT